MSRSRVAAARIAQGWSCPTCLSVSDEPCWSQSGKPTSTHRDRIERALVKTHKLLMSEYENEDS